MSKEKSNKSLEALKENVSLEVLNENEIAKIKGGASASVDGIIVTIQP